METNPSFVLEAIQHVTFRDIPVPEIEDPYDVIVQIKQTGICGYVHADPPLETALTKGIRAVQMSTTGKEGG